MTSPSRSTGSTLLRLRGSESGTAYDADELHGLDPADGRPLLAEYDLDLAARTLTRDTAAARPRGLWRWEELLPVRDAAHITTLGEGSTPLLAVPRLGRAFGVDDLPVKCEGLNPTGSFKARGMAVAVSRAVELGATRLLAPSAGNAGGALAAYAAAAGVRATILMPADVPRANREEVLVTGADLVLVDGFISDCGRLGARLAPLLGAVDVSTLKEPYRVEGKKTMGLELAEDLGWRLPDVIVYPTGGGTGLIGMWKAFAELETMGLIGSERPRMVSVQTAGCAPIVRAFAAGKNRADPWVEPTTRASGLRVPAAVGDTLILTALRESGGVAVAVEEADVDAMQVTAGRHGVGYVSPETAAALASLSDLRASGHIEPGDRVVVFDTGIGHKYPPPPLPDVPTVDPDKADVEALAATLRGGRSGARR